MLALLLTACASSAKPAPEPYLRKQALEAEAEGAQRFARGDYAGAIRRFSQAARLQQSLDDLAAVARLQLHRAHAELALGQAEAALQQALAVSDAAQAPESLLIQAQAYLALDRLAPAQASLDKLHQLCGASCAYSGSLHVLQARAALAGKRAPEALLHAKAAEQALRGKHEERETGNAWRLMAAAHLMLGQTQAALAAAQSALEIDRSLALPEKIARDWLLIGDAWRQTDAAAAVAAYQRALSVARAAAITDVVKLATEAIKENTR